jgi:hypothetical protein
MKKYLVYAALFGLISTQWLAAQQSTPASGVDPLLSGQIVNIVDWDGGQLPKRYERSQQLPMQPDDIRKLSASKFSDASIIKMLEERRCACDASVDALIDLKAAGVSEDVLHALSLHALPPNRSMYISIDLDFEGLGGNKPLSRQARQGYLYLIIPDGERERVFVGNLQQILAGRWQREAQIDRSDQLLSKQVRRVTFAADVPLKTYGEKKALVFTSARPNIYASTDLTERERAGASEYTFTYPSSSLQRYCSLQALYRQDQMLADKWHLARTNFQCEWD